VQGVLGRHLYAIMEACIDGATGDNKKMLRCEACEKVTHGVVWQSRVCWSGTSVRGSVAMREYRTRAQHTLALRSTGM
jgi:hypothetical protein